MTAYKSLLYLIFEAGLFALYIPLALLRTGPHIESSILSPLAIPLWLLGSLIISGRFWSFTFEGRGTPVPTDPPKELVVSGFYRYVRNPIYVGPRLGPLLLSLAPIFGSIIHCLDLLRRIPYDLADHRHHACPRRTDGALAWCICLVTGDSARRGWRGKYTYIIDKKPYTSQ